MLAELTAPRHVYDLAQEVLARCQQLSAESGYKTERWCADVDRLPSEEADWNSNTPVWALRIVVDFHCPCGTVQRLSSWQSVSAELLRCGHASIPSAIADETAHMIVSEFKKHVDGEDDAAHHS